MKKTIEILKDENMIKQVELEFGKTGIVYEDQYVKLSKDAVKFPNGKLGTYIRFIEPDTTKKGCVILPITQDGKIVLTKHYRFATQNDQYEIPRGFGTTGLSIEANAVKELQEELNACIKTLDFLGSIHPDTGLFEKEVYVFMAKITVDTDHPLAAIDEEEPISGFYEVTKEEIGKMISNGDLKDSFTLSAISMAMLQGKI